MRQRLADQEPPLVPPGSPLGNRQLSSPGHALHRGLDGADVEGSGSRSAEAEAERWMRWVDLVVSVCMPECRRKGTTRGGVGVLGEPVVGEVFLGSWLGCVFEELGRPWFFIYIAFLCFS